MEGEKKQETLAAEVNVTGNEEAKTMEQSSLNLPPNVAAFAELPLEEQKRIYTLSLYLMQAGILHYFFGFLYLFILIPGLIKSLSGNVIGGNQVFVLLMFAFFILLLFALGYMVRNLRSKSAQIMIKIYAILGCLGSIGTIMDGLKGNIIACIIAVILLIIFIIIFKATLCKEIFSKTALSHKQLKYIYKCKKNGETIEADKLPKGL